ncbi:phospholipase C, phosphocholine-specific [Oleiagrimonas sp. C23AA]|uniref:phosphocholine-specific phospholipase C n=1 Tax=Oleiagrimonas sp. C23AA TaxID=2719047 RepID=UPI00141FC0A5|nr:phospholipase C, phosphocholine-specific [Oleiagrimonas sp. C23AA]NII10776.1 phospholipase C, phosphocholine-specific [Oleiagrimonas sp. C23AA]
MTSDARRRFLKLGGSALGAALAAGRIPASIARAVSIPARRRTGTIADVAHVVILMQENRSFDHYFGALRGVRGFADPRPHVLPNGHDVWHQPNARLRTKDFKARGVTPDSPYLLPFHIDIARSGSHFDSTDHGWSSGHQAWNLGRWNDWVTQKQDTLTMGHLRRDDLPFHTALAEAFTLCDHYFASAHSDTAMNRIFLWTGTCDPSNTLGRRANGPGSEERPKTNGYTWTTYPERLQKAGVSWKLYQGGTGEPGAPSDNYTDNSLEFFAAYQVQEGADPNGPLVRKGVSNHTLRELRQDVLGDRLPQVSWIVAPYKYSEHPQASQSDGAWYIEQVLQALTANPEVWSRTVLLVNYDENDGLFDHVVPPMPPLQSGAGKDGVVSADLADSLDLEILDLDRYPRVKHPLVPGADPGGRQPVGLGPRVPMMVISPWSTGGWLCSETFDHTSVIRFLEQRFGVHEPNISPWRRAVCGDLTRCFDFALAVQQGPPTSPPAAAEPRHPLPLRVPAPGQMPAQEPGLRPARAVPYRWSVRPQRRDQHLALDVHNTGVLGIGFYVYDRLQPDAPPRRYAASAGTLITDVWPLDGGYALSLYGPHGSLVELHDGAAAGPVMCEAWLEPHPNSWQVDVVLANRDTSSLTLQVSDAYTEDVATPMTLPGHAILRLPLDLSTSHGWYDIAITCADRPQFLRRYAGHQDAGRPATSDPGPCRPHPLQAWAKVYADRPQAQPLEPSPPASTTA